MKLKFGYVFAIIRGAIAFALSVKVIASDAEL